MSTDNKSLMGPPTAKEKWSWCFFDFANSSFTTVIVTVVFGPYFMKKIVPEAGWHGASGETLWLVVGAVSKALVILSAPVIGALADRGATKKKWLFISYFVCCGATAMLSFSSEGTVLFALLAFLVANIAFATGENVVAGFLPELAKPSEMGRLSAKGWSVGFLGGLLSLVVAFLMHDAGLTHLVPLAIGVFFAVSGLPTFLFLRERAVPDLRARGHLMRSAFSELLSTWRERHHFKDFFRFLICMLVFQAGVEIVIVYAAIYGQEEVGMQEDAIISLFIGLQLSAAGGALAFGWIQDRLGSVQALLGALGLWIVAVVLAFLSYSEGMFWVAGILSGAAMGSSQSASRAVVGLFCPKGREAEWFGLWGLATKGSAVLGLSAFAAVQANVENGRHAILFTLLLFVAGALMLRTVNIRRGVAAAGKAAAPPEAR